VIASVRIALLGPVEVSEADRPVRLSGTKQHALVALLALNAGRLLPVDRLVDASGATLNRATP
jgi:DNA-binding SARP family transcriptional activator